MTFIDHKRTHSNLFETIKKHHSLIGADRFYEIANNLNDNQSKDSKYPFYNVEKVDDYNFRITVALAGFSKENISITSRPIPNNLNVEELVITGEINDDDREYVYKGISLRSFERKFTITKPLKILDASMENGLLSIQIGVENVEALKPKQIPIT